MDTKVDGSGCGQSLNGKFPTNLKGHLRKKHPQENLELQESETRKKQEKAMRTQSANKSKSAQLRQMHVTESFVEIIGCTCNYIFHITTFAHYIKTKTKTRKIVLHLN